MALLVFCRQKESRTWERLQLMRPRSAPLLSERPSSKFFEIRIILNPQIQNPIREAV